MTNIMNTGKSALFAFQRALATTAHNIANVDTEGYTRQRVELSTLGGDYRSMQYVGTGVRVEGIQRVYDQFATTRVNLATSDFNEQNVQAEMASRLDEVVASDGLSIAPAINDFFTSVQDANNDPASISTREILLDRTEQLANRFQLLQGQFDDTQDEVNERTRAATTQVNEYAEGIAELNTQLLTLNNGRQLQAHNDLLDKRDQLVKDLSVLIEVNTVEQDNGSLNVFIGKGINLVVDGSTQRITTAPDDVHPERLQIQIGNDGNERNLDPLLQGGTIGGLQSFADETLHPAMQKLGQLALIFADEINRQHAMGVDLDGNTGTALFEFDQPTTYSSGRNTGSGAISAIIEDASLLEPAEYVIRYDGVNFTSTRSSDGEQTSGPLPMSIDGINVTLTGTPAAGDSFVVAATNRAASSLKSLINDPKTLALAGQLTTFSSLDNIGESMVSTAAVTDITSPSLKDPVDIVFSSDTSYDIIDVNTGSTLVGGASYTPGEAINFNGWEVSISGKALANDSHRIEANTTGRGNNANGISIVDMQLEPLVDSKQNFSDAYGALISAVGAKTYSAKSRATALETLRDNAINRQQSVQGVSLDEEAVDLTRYQQAYQASAQIIATADTLFKTILNAVN
ncbi:MAG: flagellar hook-associated protein FlgK [Granulosicoccus sp.]